MNTPVIDAQVHAYERDRPERPWMSDADRSALMGGNVERIYGWTPKH